MRMAEEMLPYPEKRKYAARRLSARRIAGHRPAFHTGDSKKVYQDGDVVGYFVFEAKTIAATHTDGASPMGRRDGVPVIYRNLYPDEKPTDVKPFNR